MADEKKVEVYLVKRVESMGAWCVKFVPLFFAGFPDRFILIRGGRIIFVELKAPNGILAPLQRIILGKLKKLGFRVEVLYTREQVDIFMGTVEW